MSFKCTFYNFSKRNNSTKQPDASALASAVEYDIVLKSGCSVLAPKISLDIAYSSGAPAWNYCYIPAFSRYYFINNWYFSDRLWTATLSIDSLGTYKTQLLNTTQYVARSASQSDSYITDTMYSVKSNYSANLVDLSAKSPNLFRGFGGGTYILGVINGSQTASRGAVSYYIMNQTTMKNLMGFLLGDGTNAVTDLVSIIMNETDDISAGAVKALFNPFQYISSCIWLPMTLWEDTPSTYPSVTSIRFGHWEFTYNQGQSIVAQLIGNDQYICTYNVEDDYTPSVEFQHHPQATGQNGRGLYLDAAPYTENLLYFPPFGSIPLDGVILSKLDNNKFYWSQSLDLVTGIATLNLYGYYATGPNEGQEVRLTPPLEAQLGVPIQLSNIGTNYSNNTTLSAIALGADTLNACMQDNGKATSAVTYGSTWIEKAVGVEPRRDVFGASLGNTPYYGSSIDKNVAMLSGAKNYLQQYMTDEIAPDTIIDNTASVITGIGNTAKSLMTGVRSMGNNGNMATLAQRPYFQQIFYRMADDDNEHLGRPICMKLLLSNLSGFTQCADPDITIGTTETERHLLCAHLAKGFYIE